MTGSPSECQNRTLLSVLFEPWNGRQFAVVLPGVFFDLPAHLLHPGPRSLYLGRFIQAEQPRDDAMH